MSHQHPTERAQCAPERPAGIQTGDSPSDALSEPQTGAQPIVAPCPHGCDTSYCPCLACEADQTALRDRIAQALISWTYRGQEPDPETGVLETVRANAYSRADAVLAVLPDHAAVRAAALNEAADAVARATGNPRDANVKLLRHLAAAARPDDTTGA